MEVLTSDSPILNAVISTEALQSARYEFHCPRDRITATPAVGPRSGHGAGRRPETVSRDPPSETCRLVSFRASAVLQSPPNLRRIQYTYGTHGSIRRPNNKNLRLAFLEVATDEGVEGLCTTTMTPDQVEILRNQVIGEDPLQRERLYQMLHKGTRWVYQYPGWFGDFRHDPGVENGPLRRTL